MSKKTLGILSAFFLIISVYLLSDFSSADVLENDITVLIFNNSEKIYHTSTSLIPADWLDEVGIELANNEQFLISGNVQNISQPVARDILMQATILMEKTINVENDGHRSDEMGYSENPLEILWDAEIQLRVDTDYEKIFKIDNLTIIETLLPFRIIDNGKELTAYSRAKTVGEALAENGVALQGKDYSLPNASSQFEINQVVEIIRVREEIILETETIPFWLEYQPVADLEIDQRNIVNFGEYGIEANKIRVIYENGIEVGRNIEDSWIAKEVVPQTVGYGTKIVIRSTETTDGVIEYWRTLTMWATSYSPCRSAGEPGKCYYGTSIGLPVKKGVVAVKYSWYIPMGWHTVYVPGYGPATIADVGGGVAGKDWIDLGYSDDDYEPWASWVTVYFTTPLPPAHEIMYILP